MTKPWILALALSTLPRISAAADEPSILVVFDSRTGHTETLAKAVVEGVDQVEGVVAVLRRRDEVQDEDILSSSGILLGSPVHWASLSAESKAFLERVGQVLVEAKELGPGTTARNRTAGAFVTGGAVSSGKELARLSILAAFLNMRFVVVGGEEADGFGTLGAQATTAGSDPGVSEAELEEARRFGRRFATMTLALVR
ncbi:MAG: flavodoxin family protein [Vicinamibacteria bacterium]